MTGLVARICRSVGFPAESTEDIRKKYEPIIETYGRNLGVRLAGAIVSRAKTDGWTGSGPYPPSALQALAVRLDAILAGTPPLDTVARFAAILSVEQEYLHLADPGEQAAIALGVRERFDRVGSNHARMAQAIRSQRAVTAPLDPDVLADTVIMLNQIHSKYLLDIAREVEEAGQKSQLLYRLRGAMLVVGGGILIYFLVQLILLFSAGQALVEVSLFLLGMVLIFGLGYLGSIISVSQRMQAATADNVLEGDPVSAIGRLAAGWDSVKLSMSTAGIFALIAYVLVAANAAAVLGLSGGLFPRTEESQLCRANAQFDYRAGGAETDEERSGKDQAPAVEDGAASAATETGAADAGAPKDAEGAAEGAQGAAEDAAAAVVAASPAVDTAVADAASPASESAVAPPAPPTKVAPQDDERELVFGFRFARALGLCDQTDLLRMVVIAFLAGFAERLIPDVLTKAAALGGNAVPRRAGPPLPASGRPPGGDAPPGGQAPAPQAAAPPAGRRRQAPDAPPDAPPGIVAEPATGSRTDDTPGPTVG